MQNAKCKLQIGGGQAAKKIQMLAGAEGEMHDLLRNGGIHVILLLLMLSAVNNGLQVCELS